MSEWCVVCLCAPLTQLAFDYFKDRINVYSKRSVLPSYHHTITLTILFHGVRLST